MLMLLLIRGGEDKKVSKDPDIILADIRTANSIQVRLYQKYFLPQPLLVPVLIRAVKDPALEPAPEPDLGAASVMPLDPALIFK